MLYQPLLTNSAPYVVRYSEIKKFLANIHHETEILYCKKGSAVVRVGTNEYTLRDGNVLVIGSLVPHEGVETAGGNDGLILEIGPMFLGERFKSFAELGMECKLYTEKDESTKELCAILDEVHCLCKEKNNISELMIIGNIYKICGYILKDAEKHKETSGNVTPMRGTDIEKALELVYGYYSEPISVEKAATLCGYGKSNFCKIFKNTMGISFHAFLNSYRVNNAGYLLAESDKSLDEIAAMVGLREAKTLCRVFKEFTGMTPGEYRKQHF